MRIPIVLLLVGALFLLFTGCTDHSITTTTTATLISGTGTPIVGASVTLLQNGTTLSTFPITGANGQATFQIGGNNSASVLEVTSPTNAFPRTLFGPFRINNSSRTFTIPVLTAAQLQTQFGVVTPSNGTATLVIFGMSDFTSSATTIPVDARIGNGEILGPGTPLIITGIPASTTTVTVIDPATNRTVVFSNITFTGNTITVIRTAFNEVSTNLSIIGTLRDKVTNKTISGASLTLVNNGLNVNTLATNSSGGFIFNNLSPSTDMTIEATSSTSQFVNTIFVVGLFQQSARDVQLKVFSQTELQSQFPTVPTPPNLNTATLVVLSFDTLGAAKQLTFTVNMFTPVTGTPPTATEPAGTYPIIISDPVSGNSIALTNVTLVGGQITVIQVPAIVFQTPI